MTRFFLAGLVVMVMIGQQSFAQQKPGDSTPLRQAEQIDRATAGEWRRLERQYLVSADDRRVFEDAARSAWAYVANHYVDATGLVDATSFYPYTTIWDIASGIAALYAGHDLKLLNDATYDARMRRVLATLRTMGIVDNAAYNKVYSTRTAGMIGRDQQPSSRGYGWSSTDLGRLLVWLKIVAVTQPQYAADVNAIVKRLDFTRLVADGYMWGQDFDAAWKPHRYQEGQLGYEQYAASGFAAWGANVERALRFHENALPVAVMGHTLYADARGRDRLTSDPVVLLGLELGWDPPMEQLARSLLGVQATRYRQTGIVTMVAEDSIGQPPDFFYYYNAFTHRRAFGLDVQRRNAFIDQPRWVSAKAAVAWHALMPGPYTRLALQTVAPARTPSGWDSGVFEGTSTSTGSQNINTAAVILTAAMYDKRGHPIMSTR
jgi:hypothetical protein